MIIWPPKGPTEVEMFAFDFSDALASGESIATKTVEAEGVNLDSSDIQGSAVQLWLSGGTAGTVAKVTCAITTDSSPPATYSEVAVLEIGSEVVSLELAKQSQKIESDDEDLVLGAFLRAAIGRVESATGKKLRPKIVSQTLNGFGSLHYGREAVRLWYGPVSEVLSIEYDDPTGVTQTLADFRLVEGENAKLLPAFGQCWPLAACGEGTVRLTYIAGYDATELPPELTQAVLMLFGHYNANREAVASTIGSATIAELPLGVQWMIQPYCRPGLA